MSDGVVKPHRQGRKSAKEKRNLTAKFAKAAKEMKSFTATGTTIKSRSKPGRREGTAPEVANRKLCSPLPRVGVPIESRYGLNAIADSWTVLGLTVTAVAGTAPVAVLTLFMTNPLLEPTA